MLPWGHLALGYLCYSLGGRLDRFGEPTTAGTVALAIGTQLPDLADKPLAWHLGVLPNGRSLGHSLLVALAVVAVVRWIAAARGQGHAGTAFGFGYLSHLAGDGLYPALAGNVAELGFLGWPLAPAIDYDHTGGILTHFANLEVGLPFWFELGLVAVAIGLWYWDGMPGLWWRFHQRFVGSIL